MLVVDYGGVVFNKWPYSLRIDSPHLTFKDEIVGRCTNNSSE